MSVEHLEFIALFQQPFDGAGQGIFHVLFRFQGIVDLIDTDQPVDAATMEKLRAIPGVYRIRQIVPAITR